jgi:hypothetical protein
MAKSAGLYSNIYTNNKGGTVGNNVLYAVCSEAI